MESLACKKKRHWPPGELSSPSKKWSIKSTPATVASCLRGSSPQSASCPAAPSLPMPTATTSATTLSTKLGTPFPAIATLSRPGCRSTYSTPPISPNIAPRSNPKRNREAMLSPAYSPQEMMTIAAARRLKSGSVCFVGIGLPSAAANLARMTHAPGVVLIYESGAIGAKPWVLPLSIGDGELAETADTVVSVPEIFRYWLQGGRVDLGFLGAAQIDRFGNINTTVIGDYRKPSTRLPGAGGAPEIASCAKEVVLVLKQSARAFVKKLDFLTSVGHLDGGDARKKLSLPGKGPVAVVTDLCIMQPDEATKELTVTQLHPGVSREQVVKATGWEVRFAGQLEETPVPTATELETLRDLERRTRLAHGDRTAAQA